MKKIGMMSAVLAVLLMITGCWDQDLLKNARLLYGGGFDLAPDGKLLTTFVIRDMPESEQQIPKNEIIYAVGNTPREARDKADDQISRLIRTYRNRFVLIGEELAKQDIFPILDIFYRDPKSALNARIGVTQGKTTDILSLKRVGNVLIAEEIDELIKSKEETTTVPKVTLEKIYPVMLDPGEDFVLPYLIHKGNQVDVSRIAMFHDQRLTGVLSPDESTMCLLLQASEGKLARFTQKISAQNGKSNIKDFITFNVDKSKREMEVSKTLKKMQNARCDGLGIARQLMAYHPDIWKKQKENWGSHYQKVKFDPNIQVEIGKKAIIN